ncbi:MAG: hypothetical protein RR348_00565 [Clostridia bacterium]
MIDKLPLILSSVTAIVAIISPIILSIISNKQHRKLESLKLMYVQKQSVFEDLITYYTLKYKDPNINVFSSKISKAILVANDKTAMSLNKLLDAINTPVDENYTENHFSIFRSCLTLMQQDLNTST